MSKGSQTKMMRTLMLGAALLISSASAFSKTALSNSQPQQSPIKTQSQSQALKIDLQQSLNLEKKRPHLVLTARDSALYKKIFAVQKKGDMKQADLYISKLHDKRLLGYVKAQRYLHPTAYVSSVSELSSWMKSYSDLPMAARMYKLAQRKAKKQQIGVDLTKPKSAYKMTARLEPTMIAARPYHKMPHAKGAAVSYNKALEKDIMRALRQGKRDKAVDLVFKADKNASASAAEIDYLKSKVAENYLYAGHVKMAHELASQAFDRSGVVVPLAGWVYGLTTWYNGNIKAAVWGFESAASSDYNSSWMRAAASFWAARALRATGRKGEAAIWLRKAQKYPRTFYGLLAAQEAKTTPTFNWSAPTLTRDMVRAMAQQQGTMRALALMDIGRYDLAEQEMLYIPNSTRLLRSAMLAFAQSYDMAELSMRLGAHVKLDKNTVHDAALYPSMDFGALKPSASKGKSPIDIDLIHAIVRQESRFNPLATSNQGAAGLMQIMPATAQYIAKKSNLPYAGKRDLFSANKNIRIGQSYLRKLLSGGIVKDDVVSLLIAYNAGPGNLQRWRKLWSDVKDPLLFIELLPSSETRTYVEKVLANYWIYRIKNKRDLSPIKPLLKGEPLTYASLTADRPYALAKSD